MTTETSAPDILSILSAEAVRERFDAPLAALSRDLGRFVWANAAGARLLGLGAAGPLADRRRGAGADVPRQIRAVARALAEAGRARTALRLPGGGLADPVAVAELVAVADGTDAAFVLLVLPADARSAGEIGAVDPAVRLLREAGGGETGSLAVLNPDGTVAAMDPGFPLEWIAGLATAIAAFAASGEDRATLDPDGARLAVARLARRFVALRVEPDTDAAQAAAGAPAAAGSAEAPPQRGVGRFSNRRPPLSRPVRRPALASLLAAWSEAPAPRPAPPPAEAEAEAVRPAHDGVESPAAKAEPARGEPAAPLTGEARPVEAAAAPAVAAPVRRRLHSTWGAAPAPAGTGDRNPLAEESRPVPPAEPGEAALAREAAEAAPVAAAHDEDSAEPAGGGAADIADITADEAAEAAPTPIDVSEPSVPVAREAAASPAEKPSAAAFRPRFDVGPVRFAWRIDAGGLFRSLSPEFAATVGPRSAAVIGRSFSEIADLYGFDADGEMRRLLVRRETWSGRSIDWPVEGSDRKVPVDLAALPTYARDRSFDGFRGFGILRPSESVADPDAIGLAIAAAEPRRDEPAAIPQAADARPAVEGGDPLRAAVMAASPFGRRGALPPPETPSGQGAAAEPAAGLPKVIRLEERRRFARVDGLLTPDEEDAFRAIGTTLAEPPEAERASRLVAGERGRAGAPFEAADGEAADDADPMLGDLEPVFSALPLPILVQMRETLVAANAEFLEMTGYRDVAALTEAGGLAHLFADSVSGTGGRPGALSIRRADGGLAAVSVHMQRATVRGRSCLVMSFSQDGAEPGAAPAPAAPALRAAGGEAPPLDTESRLAVLSETLQGIVVFDAANRVEAMDEAAHALFGIPAGDAAGRPFTSLFALESQKPLIAGLASLWSAAAPATGFAESRDVLGRTARGGFQPLAVSLGRLSATRGWCAVMREEPGRRSAERELLVARRRAEAANVQKSHFLANVSHELRTPLNAIIGFADVMAAEAFGPLGSERYMEYLADIKRSGHHLLDLVNDLLDISKIEAGKWDLTLRPLDLNELVGETVGLMQTEAQRARVIVRTNLPRSVPSVEADGRSVRQMALNLLANAVRFTPSGGQIVVSTSHSAGGEVILRVRDTGIGMTREEIDVALSPFGQIRPPERFGGERPAGERQGSEGTGLGLPLTKAIAEANGARFAIASTPGEGTVVEIAFPRERVAAE